jgi:hypothetical protein
MRTVWQCLQRQFHGQEKVKYKKEERGTTFFSSIPDAYGRIPPVPPSSRGAESSVSMRYVSLEVSAEIEMHVKRQSLSPFVLIHMLSVLTWSTSFRRKGEFRFGIFSDVYPLATFGYDGKDGWTGPHGCAGKVAEEEWWRAGTVHHPIPLSVLADARWHCFSSSWPVVGQ